MISTKESFEKKKRKIKMTFAYETASNTEV